MIYSISVCALSLGLASMNVPDQWCEIQKYNRHAAMDKTAQGAFIPADDCREMAGAEGQIHLSVMCTMQIGEEIKKANSLSMTSQTHHFPALVRLTDSDDTRSFLALSCSMQLRHLNPT